MKQGTPDSFQFIVIAQGERVPSNVRGWRAYLNRDRWDDWGKYCTQFYLSLVDPDGAEHPIGSLKVGESGLKPSVGLSHLPAGHRIPSIPSRFAGLEAKFFSLGQDDEYYEKLKMLDDPIREHVLRSLRDVAFDPDLWEMHRHEDVMSESLMRFVTRSTMLGQFRRMAQGGVRLTRYYFTYTPPKRLGDGAPPYDLEFDVNPESPIPTNVHVLIGRNGVGKTRLLSLMAKALVTDESSARQSGKFKLGHLALDSATFANLVAVSFSAFDDAELLPESKIGENAIGYAYIGLRRKGGSTSAAGKPKSVEILAREFVDSLDQCRIEPRRRRWIAMIGLLQSDPVFNAAQVHALIDKDLRDVSEREAVFNTFKKRLSSGHKIVLLTLTRLVEVVEERTLVLIDEPEGHLHPPLLSAMVRAISTLMVDRNGVAIIATHSPVILQEVPKSCVWILNRTLSTAKAERPSIETFAENVGVLSREVFQLELSQSGYNQILNQVRRRKATYEAAIDDLDGQVGAEGRAVLRALYLDNEE